MANGLTIGNRTIKSISALSLERISDGLVFNWASPTSFNLSEGIEQREQEVKNETGETVRAGSFVTARRPTLTIGYQNINPEMISWRVGNYLEVGTYTTRMPMRLWVTKGEYAGSPAGFRGFGIAADVNIGTPNAPRAAVTRGEISTALTQAAYADYSTWRTQNLRFAVGANGALRFSNDIVAAQDVVTLSIPLTGEMSRISDLVVGDHRLYAMVVDSLNKIHILEVYQASPDLSGAAVDLSADTLEVTMFLNNPPGFCRAWQMFSPTTNNQLRCAGE